MVSASHSLRSVFYAFRVGSYEVEKSKRRVISWVDGISVGVLVSLAASNLGMKGCLLCLIGVSPQFLFYIPAYFMILKYCYESEDGRWNRQKTIFVGLMMSLGIITELYVNPVLVKLFLNYV